MNAELYLKKAVLQLAKGYGYTIGSVGCSGSVAMAVAIPDTTDCIRVDSYRLGGQSGEVCI